MFFTHCTTPADVKSLYRELAMKHHPDRGGNTRTMQDINTEYLEALRRLDGHVSRGTDGKDHTYRYNEVREQSVIDKVGELIHLQLPSDVEIWIVGVWIWVKGNTKPVKEEIKSVDGMRWHNKRICWYWKPYAGKTRYSGKSFNDLAATYGAKLVDREEKRNRVPLPA